MKCEFCGANIDIESEKCPFCGMSKTQFETHRRDMDNFKNAYKDMEKKVLEKNRRTTEKTVRVTIVAILCLLIVMAVLLGIFSTDIRLLIKKNQIKANTKEHIEKLESYEESEDYIGFYTYYTYKELHYMYGMQEYKEYRLTFDLCRCYYYYTKNLSEVMYYKDKIGSAINMNAKLESLVDSYEDFYKTYNDYVLEDKANRYMYEDSCYLDNHMKSYDSMAEDIKDFTMTYFNMTEEEYEEFVNASKGRKITMLEDAL